MKKIAENCAKTYTRLAGEFTRLSARTNPLIVGVRGISFGVDVAAAFLVMSALSAPAIMPICVTVFSGVIAAAFFHETFKDLKRMRTAIPFYTDRQEKQNKLGQVIGQEDVYAMPRTATVFLQSIDEKLEKMTRKYDKTNFSLVKAFYAVRIKSCKKTRESVLTAKYSEKLPGGRSYIRDFRPQLNSPASV